MPLFWRYLLKSYFKSFFLCIGSFVAILLTLRIREIASFTALGANLKSTLLFCSCQIPQILPIAMPISSFIASVLLFQRMSRSHELSSLRAAGISLSQILTPILVVASALTLINFYITSELTTHTRLYSMKLLYDNTSANPLLLMQRQKLIKIPSSYIDIKEDASKNRASDLYFISYNPHHHHLALVTAKKLQLENDVLIGRNLAMISYLDGEPSWGYDPLILENEGYLKMHAPTLSYFMKKTHWKLNAISLPLRLLWIFSATDHPKEAKNIEGFVSLKYMISPSILPEVFRRFFLGLTVLTLTVIGMSYSLELTRNLSRKSFFTMLLLSLFILATYFLGKKMKEHEKIALCLYSIPHCIAYLLCSIRIHRFSRGKIS